MNPKNTKLGTEVLSGLTAKIVLTAIGFLGSIVFARVLGADGYGAFYIILAGVVGVQIPITGVATSAKKRLSEPQSDVNAVFGAFLAFLAVFYALTLVGLFLFRGTVQDFVGLQYAWILFFGLLFVKGLDGPLTTLLTAEARVGLNQWLDSFRSLLTIPAQIGLVLLGWGVFGMVVGLTIATGISAGLAFHYLGLRPSMPTRDTFYSLYDFARFSVLKAFLSFSQNKLLTLIIGAAFAPAAAGVFEVARNLTMPAAFVASLTSSGLMAKVSADTDGALEDISNSLGYTSVLSIPMFFGALAFPQRLIVTVYGPNFAEGALILVGLSLFQVIRTRTRPVLSVLRGLDRPDLDVYITLLSVCVLLAVGVPLLIQVGVIGIVIGMIVAELVSFGAGMIIIQRYYELAWFPGPFPQQVASALGMFVVVKGLTLVVPLKEWYQVVGVVAVGVAVYGVLLVALSQNVRHLIWSIVEEYTNGESRVEDILRG